MEITLPQLSNEESNLLQLALDIVIRIAEKNSIATKENIGGHDAKLDFQANLHHWQHVGFAELRQKLFPSFIPGNEVTGYMEDFVKYYTGLNVLQEVEKQ